MMPPYSTSSTAPLVQAAPETLLALRATLLTRADLDTVFALRDAGYAGGDALYNAFAAYLKPQGYDDPQALSADTFFQQAGAFLTHCGWGGTSISNMNDAFCAVDIDGCWEAAPEYQPDPRGCHLTVGLLGAFLGKFADYPISILETEGPATGTTQCRFLAGNTEMIADYYATHT
jgi:predicted hydrocarbon binding protein